MTTKTKNLDSAAVSAFVSEQTEFRKAKLLEALFPAFRWLQLLPISSSAPAGATVIKQTMYTPTGMAAFVAQNADDIPDVTVVADEHFAPVREMADKFDDSLTEIENAMMAGVPLEQKKMNALVRGLDQLKNSVALLGDAARGLFGILTHPNTNKVEAENGSWTMSTTVADIMEDVNLLIHKSFTVSGGVEDLTVAGANGKVVFPTSCWSILMDKSVSDLRPEYTILMNLRDKYPNVEFTHSSDLDAVATNPRTGGAGPVKVAVAFQAIEDKISLEVPLELDILPPQRRNLVFRTIGRAKTAGVFSNYPLSVTIMDGL